jgi:hypothetical protein
VQDARSEVGGSRGSAPSLLAFHRAERVYNAAASLTRQGG